MPFCGFWVHKRWSNVKGPLKHNTDFKCKKCRGEVSNTNTPDIDPLDIKGEKIEKFRYFCYLADRHGRNLEKFCQFYNACVRSVLLYAGETCSATQMSPASITMMIDDDKMDLLYEAYR